MIKKLFLLILFFRASSSFAQSVFESDSIHPSQDTISIEKYFSNLDFEKFDSTNYFFNPLVTHYENPGTSLSFHFKKINHLEFKKFESKNNNFQIKIPRTYVYYGVMSAKQQNFYIQHIQNLKQFNIEADYSKKKGDGFYLHQEYATEKLNAQISYSSKKKNYFIIGGYHYDRINQNENGGISSDSLFENKLFTNSQTLSVKLNSANNQFISHTGKLNQYFIPIKLNNKLHFNQELIYQNYSRTYSDIPDTSFYSYILIDSTQTNDLYSKEYYSHEININFNSFLIGKIGFKTEYLSYSQNNIDTTSLLNSLDINLYKRIKKITLDLKSKYFLSGFNSNNYEINSNLNYNIEHEFLKNIQLKIDFFNQSPEMFYLKLHTNNYRWNNLFSNYNQFYSKISIGSKFGNLAYHYSFFNNYIFLNQEKTPQQVSELIHLNRVSYSVMRNFKKINLKLFASYQKGDEEYYRLPELLGYADINLNGRLKALELKFGITAWYYSSFYSNGYDPALNQYYLQDETKTGNYPYFDFYIRSSIKSVEMKFSIQHFNSGLMNSNYYSTLSYPSAPRRFSFSLSWKFTD